MPTAEEYDGSFRLDNFVTELNSHGVRRIHVLAWRDLDDPDAGGSEVHADECMRRWAAAGLDVLHRTSAAVGRPRVAVRNGYRVVRRGSRYSVFPRTMVSELLHRMGPRDALVEIWNGVPWMSPIWFRGPRMTFIHHVHGPMWDQMFPPPFGAVGRLLEARLAPPFYRRGLTATPSDSTRDEVIEVMGLRPERVVAIPNGVDSFFHPGGERETAPMVVAVGRQAPVKRFVELLNACEQARAVGPHPTLRLVLVGDGPDRGLIEAWIAEHQASAWVTLAGRVSNEELRDLYRRAWLVASASLAEGWGLALTEGAACGTPSVATDISGHRCSVIDGETGILVAELSDLGAAIARVISDDALRSRLGEAARRRAATLTWDRVAHDVLGVLLTATREHRRAGR